MLDGIVPKMEQLSERIRAGRTNCVQIKALKSNSKYVTNVNKPILEGILPILPHNSESQTLPFKY